jgi:predicted dehydrogenase
MKTLRVGIIGCGNMGRRHARAYEYHQPRTRLVACCDLIPSAAESLAAKFNCHVERDVDALLSRDDIDAVSICTIESAHLDPVIKAANAGKHVLLEKPMATVLSDALAMQQAADKANIKFMIAHLFRFDARCVEIKRTIESGRIGDVVSVDCKFHGTPSHQDRIKETELSIFIFRGCHGIDLMRWYTESDPIRVYAESKDGVLRAQGYHSEDAVFCLLRFASDAIGSIEINSHVPPGHPTAGQSSMTVIGTKGMIEQNLASPWLRISDMQGMSLSQGNQKDLWFREEIDAFARYVLEDGPNIASPKDAIAALRVSLAAVESARTFEPVYLDWND